MSDNPGTKQQKENAAPKEQLEATKKWLQLAAQARTDKTLKQRLMDAPAAVLKEHGINVRQGLDVRVVENTDKVVYLTLPSVSQLSDRDLDGVVGGVKVAEDSGGTADTILNKTGIGDVVYTVGVAIVNTIASIIPS
jgi:hypothetical protein